MKFAVLGGDERSVCLVRRLRQDGHEVQTYGLECSQEMQGEAPEESAEEDGYGADDYEMTI